MYIYRALASSCGLLCFESALNSHTAQPKAARFKWRARRACRLAGLCALIQRTFGIPRSVSRTVYDPRISRRHDARPLTCAVPVPGAVAPLPTSTSSRHQIRRRRHCRSAQTGAERRRHGCARARSGEVWTAAHCSRSLPSGGTAARCRRRGVCRPRGAHMSPRRCGSRGERLDGGGARTGAVARGWTSGSMRPRALPFHSRARNAGGTSAQNTLSNTWFRFCSIATTF